LEPLSSGKYDSFNFDGVLIGLETRCVMLR
jgi:hypothetical protein